MGWTAGVDSWRCVHAWASLGVPPCTDPLPCAPVSPPSMQSIKRLNATCDWRASTQPQSVVCKACARNSRSHYMHVVGHDLQGRPIIYSCVALAENKVFEDNRDHMVSVRPGHIIILSNFLQAPLRAQHPGSW